MLSILLCALLLGSCNAAAKQSIGRWHDDKYAVTCWTNLKKGGIACLPDAQVLLSEKIEVP